MSPFFAGLVSRIEQVHQAIGGRAFCSIGPVSAPVHGLVETENSWVQQASRSEPCGRRLQAEFGYTPVYVRYNTGRHVSDNGRELAGCSTG